jgi:hypothetical protein
VPHVVCIHKDFKIMENAMKLFISTLTSQMLKLDPIAECVQFSLTRMQLEHPEVVNFCCCMHDHDANCPWIRYRQKLGEENKDLACLLHSPLESCDCSNQLQGRAHNEHLSTCIHVKKFYSTL